jgi:hypothetical protein
MSNPIIERVIEILETDPDFYVPVKKLWLMLRSEGLIGDTELSKLQTMLQTDGRFEFIEPTDHSTDPEHSPTVQAEMEALGFFGGPRVKLISREISNEDILAALASHVDRLNEALRAAWETRPEDSQVEVDLMQLLMASQRLGKEMNKLFNESARDDVEDDD